MRTNLLIPILPAVLAFACASSEGPNPDARCTDIRASDQGRLDAAAAEASPSPDAHMAGEVPVAHVDAPSPLDASPSSLDVAIPIDGATPADAPPLNADGNKGPDHYDYDMPIDMPLANDSGGTGVDGAKTDAWLVTYADGRVLTVVAACQLSPAVPTDGNCPSTYAAGLAKVRDQLDASPSFSRTGAGRCSEGSYVYAPYMDTSAQGCYYDADAQRLVGVAYYSDTMHPCGEGDTLSFTFYRGQNPPCTDITWEALK